MVIDLEKGIELAIEKLGEHKIYGTECVSACPFCGSEKHKFYLNIETEQGTYVLRTLYVKGIGLRKSSPHVAYAQKCAEEIRDYVYSLKD